MTQRYKKHLLRTLLQFLKLQLASNILFWGTLGGTFVLKELVHWEELPALALAALIAHILFFIVDKSWVFNARGGDRKTRREIIRFMIFMGLNYCINIGLTQMWWALFGINVYIAQFLNGLFFTFWTYAGLKLWVFHPDHTRHSALTYHRLKKDRHGRTKTK